ncbi:electron transfer flavoprotein regulatory factor 1 [Cylas formicarius]|uniref:electron transfer flavoprotein regulatory factor 1 n=1 Tax=Cylas formicarius TaxID=197179 RepID=UPI0029584D68|nr:electron transfer flavoprotein regulatory factor 1 [Cylas formicarius]
MSLRSQVISLYKTLLYLGREYPSGYDFFRKRLHNAFLKNKDVKDPDKIEKMIAHGQYIVRELEALYKLKKYRTLKRRYYN